MSNKSFDQSKKGITDRVGWGKKSALPSSSALIKDMCNGKVQINEESVERLRQASRHAMPKREKFFFD